VRLEHLGQVLRGSEVELARQAQRVGTHARRREAAVAADGGQLRGEIDAMAERELRQLGGVEAAVVVLAQQDRRRRVRGVEALLVLVERLGARGRRQRRPHLPRDRQALGAVGERGGVVVLHRAHGPLDLERAVGRVGVARAAHHELPGRERRLDRRFDRDQLGHEGAHVVAVAQVDDPVPARDPVPDLGDGDPAPVGGVREAAARVLARPDGDGDVMGHGRRAVE
jgi:hypothetical protein